MFAWGPRALGGRGANRRKDRGPKLVVEVGAPKRARGPLAAPVAAEDGEEAGREVAAAADHDGVPTNVHTADTARNVSLAADGG